jgi:hypothetical protein
MPSSNDRACGSVPCNGSDCSTGGRTLGPTVVVLVLLLRLGLLLLLGLLGLFGLRLLLLRGLRCRWRCLR